MVTQQSLARHTWANLGVLHHQLVSALTMIYRSGQSGLRRAYMQTYHSLILAFGLIGCCANAARGDTFLLQNGGMIHGEWLNRNARDADVYEVLIDGGVRLRLVRGDVREVVMESASESEYKRLAPTFRDTVEEQWKLAEWCRLHRLKPQREEHLRRIIELDETCIQAWHALGYTQVTGRWVTKGEIPREQGKIFFQGRWRLPQEIELMEQKAQFEQAEREWRNRIKRWRTAIVNQEKNGAAARDELLTVRDPVAARPLTQALAAERIRAMKLLWVEALGHLDNGAGIETLMDDSLSDRDIEVAHACLDIVVARKSPEIVAAYVKALRHDNNDRVNRAAFALGRLGDSSAVGPLIDALITTHRVVLKPGRRTDAIMAGFSKTNSGDGSASPETPFVSKDNGPTTVMVPMRNQEVIAALTQLAAHTGFGFDQKAWRIWFDAQKKKVPQVNLRRND